ncbi:MAG TPA: hypothetical protein H9985_03955 [Candidatus Anaerofilum faecale]|nr:hypothetical protein [Candidatus Anaerofilum faecale]
MNKYTKAVRNGLVCFLTVLILVALAGWILLGVTAIATLTGIPGWVWALLAIVAGLAGIAAEQRGDDR